MMEGYPLSPPEKIPSLLQNGSFLNVIDFRKALEAGLIDLDEVSLMVTELNLTTRVGKLEIVLLNSKQDVILM